MCIYKPYVLPLAPLFKFRHAHVHSMCWRGSTARARLQSGRWTLLQDFIILSWDPSVPGDLFLGSVELRRLLGAACDEVYLSSLQLSCNVPNSFF